MVCAPFWVPERRISRTDRLPVFVETPELSGDTIVYLVNDKREWLAGRYINVTWDMPQFMEMKDDIVKGDKLKVRLVL